MILTPTQRAKLETLIVEVSNGTFECGAASIDSPEDTKAYSDLVQKVQRAKRALVEYIESL